MCCSHAGPSMLAVTQSPRLGMGLAQCLVDKGGDVVAPPWPLESSFMLFPVEVEWPEAHSGWPGPRACGDASPP